MPKYTVIIGGKERTIDKDKFDGNVEAISLKYPDAKIKAINGGTEGMLPVSNYSKAIQQGYRMVEMNDVEPVAAPVVDSSLVQQRDSVQDYRPVIAGDVNKPFDIVKEMNEPTDIEKREAERKRIEEQAVQAKKIADAKSLHLKDEMIHADAQAIRENPFSLVTELLTGTTALTPKQVEVRKKAELNRATSEKSDDTFNLIEEAKKKGDTTFVSGFGRGFWEKASKTSTWDFGARDLQSNLAVLAAAKKYSGGLPLSEEEEVLLDAVALEAAALGEFSGDLGRGYKAGGTTAESIPFMAEFMINPATGTGSAVGKAAAKKLITNFGKEAAKSTIGKIARGAARVAGDVAGAGIMAGTSGAMRTSADAVDRMTGEVKPTVDADGYYRFGGTEEGDSGVKAFAKAYGASTIENFSEMFGSYLIPIGAAAGGAAGRSLNKVGLGKVNDIIGRVKSSDVAKIVNDFQGRTQWNGTIGEYLEEQAGMAMNALTVGDNSLSDLVDVNTQIDTFLGVSAFGGFFSGIKTAGYARQKYAENKQLNEMERKASSVFGEDWKPLKEQIDNADDTELVSIMSNTMLDSDISDWSKQLVLLYAGRLKAYHGASLADLKRKTEGETPDEVVQSQFNFDAGYKLAEADKAEKRKAARELRDVESKLDDDFLSADESSRYDMLRQRKDIGEDVSNELAYINAQSKFDGMIQGVRDVIDEKVAQSNQYITSVAHQDGNIYDVTLTTDEKKHVYPISGSIVIDDNGIVDRKQSDSRFITRDENGKIEMRSVEDLYKVESTENADVIKEATAQSIREQESARYAEEIDTPSEEEKAEEVGALQPGSEVSLNMGGVQCAAVVQSVYSDGGIELRFEDKITGHDGKEKNVDVFTAEEVAALLIPKETLTNEKDDVKNGTEKEGEVRENAGVIQKEGEESDIVPAAVEAETLPEVELRPDTKVESENAGSSISVDEKGNLLYHRTPVDVTLDNVRSYGLDEAETDEFVSAQKVDASKRLEKLQKGKPKVGTNLAKYQSEKKAWEVNLMDVQAQVDYWNEVDAQIQATRIQPGDMTAEAINSMGDPMNGEEFAAMMLGTRKLPLLFDDYKRETGFGNQDAKGMFGLFSAKGNGGMSIEQAGEKLMEMDAANGTGFFDQADANAGRNAVLEVLSSSSTRGDLFGYIKGNRERMAKEERRAEYSAYEQWVNNVKRMSVADYEADEETIESRMKEISESFNFDEINGDIADDLIKEENDRRTKESGVEPITGGGAENIQGEFDGSAESGGVGRPEISGVIGESQKWRERSADENGISGADVVGTQQSNERIGGSLFDYTQHIDDSRRIAQAEKIVDTEPTEAQKEAGNYRMGHVKIGGNDVTIENPQGSVRRGVGADGKAWETPMNNTYGYFRGTKGKDGDHVDVFLGANLKPESVYVVDQVKEDGSFDEHKVMYGFDSAEEAREAYLSNYEEGWKGLGEITGVSREVFDEWLGNGTKKQKPFAEYKKVQQVVSEEKQDIVASVQAEAISFVTGRNMDEVKDELIGKSSDGIRFRLVEDDVSEFVAKHNLDEAEVRKYAESMRLGNLGGASCAFHEIRRKVRIDNTTDSLQQFAHRFAPIKKELYEAFGSVDELREEAVRATMMERNTMEAARKRVETEEETERIRLQEFQDMSDSQLDSEYFKAIGENNESRMRDLVNEAARRSGYMYGAEFRMAHGAPTYDESGIDKSLVDVANNKDQIRDSLNELLRMNRDEAKDESAAVIDEALTAIDNGENPTVTIYRAVPKSLKEGTVRSGDWVTLSKSYAKLHGEHTLSGDYRIMKDEVPAENLYWDGNDINEWGYDDRSDYRYKNTKNNRKLNDLITSDDKGNIIPLSKRFNSGKKDVRYRIPAVLLEKGERIEKLRNSQPVEITGEEIVPSNNLKEYKKNALEYGKSLRGEYENRDTGAKISLGKSGVKEVLNHDFKDIAQLQSVAAIPQIIENSIYIDAIENLDVEKNADVSKYHYYVCGLKIDGIDYTVRAVVAEQPNGERFYDHKLTRIGKGKLIDSLSGITTPGFNQSTPLSEYKDKKLISILQMNSDKSEKEIDDIIFSINKLSEILRTPIKEVHNVSEITDVDSTVEKRKRKAKGWFDTVTGEVVIVLPNAVSAEDAQATILHEVVAHKGLRDMFGKEFDSFLDKVYRDVDEPIRAKITALSRNHGFDTHVATEEYLAGLAERGFEDVGEKSVWDKVKDFFMEMLFKAGIKMSAPLSDADLRYVLWRSYENQVGGGDIVAKAKDAAIRGISKADVRFREEAEQEIEDIAKREYEDSLDKAKNKMYRWQEAYQDSMLGLKKMQESIEKESGEKLQYFEDAYMAENQMSSRSGYETDVYKDKFFVPMMDAVRALVKNGAKQKDVSHYVMAKHGLERNVVFAKRDAERAVEDEFRDELSELNKLWDKGEIELELFDERIEELNARKIAFYEEVYQKNRNRDYSGLKQLTDEEENFEEAAMDLVNAFEDAHSSLCDALWEKVNAATKQTLKKSYESGLMTKSTYDKVRGMFEYYVPLRGWDDKVASDVYEYVLSERSVFQAPVKTAFGRESLADDPFANIGNMAESGILQGNRNLMKQKFLNMVLNHPTSLATVKTMWYENVGSSEKPVWEQSFPDIKPDATADEIAQSIDDHEARMAELGKSGMSKKSTKGVNLDYRASTREINEHIVVVKSGGREYVIFVNGNPRAAQAINGLTNPDATDHKFMQTVGKINRQLAANFTTRNPAFVLSNMSRDVIFSKSAIRVKEDWKYAKRFNKNIKKNIGGVVVLMARYKSGKLDMRNQRDKYFLEFLENGGETGYTALHNVEEYKKMMNRHVRKSNGPLGSLNSGAHAIIDAVSFMNRCAENVSRFTTYQTSREVGRGIAESVRDAKEVTVNFNKKGAGGLGAGTFKSLFLFFNAAVQSLSNFKGLHDKSKGKFYTTLGGFAAAGILLPMLNNFIIESLVGDGDDDMTDEEREQWKRKIDSYDNLPEWVRKNNFCLWTGGEHFITIPLPIELRAFYGLGEMWYQMGRGNMNGVDGKLDAKKVSLGMVNQLTELLPINPLGGNGDAISVLVPDAGKPFYQVMRNRDFFGKPIYKKNDYNELMPTWTKAFSGTAKWMVNSAEFVNEVSGGDKYMQGSVDLNPATIEHVFEGYFGGMGKTANQLYKTLSMIWDEDERMWRNVPVANRFFTGSDNKISFRKVNDAYYQYLDEYKETEQRLRGYENEAEMDIEKYAEKYDFLNGSKQHERYLLMKEYKSEIDAMRDAIKESDPEEKKEIEMEMNLLKMEMIEELGLIE